MIKLIGDRSFVKQLHLHAVSEKLCLLDMKITQACYLLRKTSNKLLILCIFTSKVNVICTYPVLCDQCVLQISSSIFRQL